MGFNSGFKGLTRLDEKLREKRPTLQKKIIFYQDNAPPNKSVLAMIKLRDLHYELLEHPPYCWNMHHIVGTSTLFPRFASPCLLSLPKTQTLPRWSVFFFESRGDFSCRGVFCRFYEEPLQGLDNGAGASLE